MIESRTTQTCRGACRIGTVPTPTAKRSQLATLVVVLLSIVVLAVAMAAGRREEKNDIAVEISSPQAAIEATLNAIQVDDLKSVLTGVADAQTENGAREMSSTVAGLRERRAELTGHVISEINIANDETASLMLELIYRKDNVRFEVGLRRVDGQWRVVTLKPVAQFAPEIPYGMPVVQ